MPYDPPMVTSLSPISAVFMRCAVVDLMVASRCVDRLGCRGAPEGRRVRPIDPPTCPPMTIHEWRSGFRTPACGSGRVAVPAVRSTCLYEGSRERRCDSTFDGLVQCPGRSREACARPTDVSKHRAR